MEDSFISFIKHGTYNKSALFEHSFSGHNAITNSISHLSQTKMPKSSHFLHDILDIKSESVNKSAEHSPPPSLDNHHHNNSSFTKKFYDGSNSVGFSPASSHNSFSMFKSDNPMLLNMQHDSRMSVGHPGGNLVGACKPRHFALPFGPTTNSSKNLKF
jgi:hypothetical protein